MCHSNYRHPDDYIENKEKDTPENLVNDTTYVPTLATFEMDLMQKYGIEEKRTPRKTFWY